MVNMINRENGPKIKFSVQLSLDDKLTGFQKVPIFVKICDHNAFSLASEPDSKKKSP